MADNLEFDSLAAFATLSMLPVGDEEVNAIWGRKTLNNIGRAVGEWGTVILNETDVTNLGSAEISFPSGFSHQFSVDMFQLRGGTQVFHHIPGRAFTQMQDLALGFLGLEVFIRGGTSVIFSYYADHRSAGALGTLKNSGGRDQFGTFMYRFRGW